MTDLNSVNIGGRITKDAVLETTKDGVSMVRVSMAINRSVKKKDSNEFEDKPIFVDLAPLFGKYAEAMYKYFTKGKYITVEGYLDMDSWKSADGKNNTRLKVVPKVGGINPWVERKQKTEGQPESFEESPIETDIYSETDDFNNCEIQ